MIKSRLLIAGFIAGASAIAVPLVAAVAVQESGLTGQDFAVLAGVIQLVRNDYVHPVGSDELVKDALKGMLNRLDPHSDYMDEQEFKDSQADTAGKFGGLGMQISEQDGVPKIIAPIDGTPAARAKLEPGDLIVTIDHTSTLGVSLQKVVDQLRGDPGSNVTITILRGKQDPFDVTLTREIIKVASVKPELKPDGIGYIRITQFGGDTSDSFKKAITDFKQKANGGVKGLVIDLRDDPGGLLTAAVDVAGDLLDGGSVVSIHGRHADDQRSFDAPTHGDMLPGVPVVVLINGASASASEIVAGALQDRHRATIMGTQSFGKGSVQTIVPVKGHGAVRLTTALYYTPSGRSIQDEGIAPDVVVEAPKDQQISGGPLLREAALQGAFKNPGPLKQAPGAGATQAAASQVKSTTSAPIKADLIGKPDDAQLKAALTYLDAHAGGKQGSTGQQEANPGPK
ncbi:Carboxy-terminal-processing protease precursor (C-terminal-processing protease) [Bradyrhizobium sp. STM 3843]|uniref:S41 family peptidase n=1 Tax=Bradyrhizobium sp. STM 3843 TaxID=551947 RepID=UPI000240A429|nr:S41 family peptidase [Bradyrhizobium sp. STM 3843]CCE04374.1 Carboxy-terminal-processing protease precursor (C-terminal-processing protease) [Bradyrhizobium sp. STM 3843]